jgi:hypothetical protein
MLHLNKNSNCLLFFFVVVCFENHEILDYALWVRKGVIYVLKDLVSVLTIIFFGITDYY